VNDVAALVREASDLRSRVLLARATHYKLADRRARTNQNVGGVTVVFSTIVSAGILTGVHKHHGTAFTLAAGIVSLAAGLLAGLQSFYKFGESGERHRLAGANFGGVRNDIDFFLAQYSGADSTYFDAARKELKAQTDRFTKLEQAGPGYPGRVYDRIKRQQEAQSKQKHAVDSAAVPVPSA
jgi:hypothetical protein